ncbi:MAG: hypothetical protein KDA44_17825 [Planctomycetales bacterium]|nr:hypothetical protein [Planctomycetales bacterium]
MIRRTHAMPLVAVALLTTFVGCCEPVEITHPICEIGDDVDVSPYLGVWECAYRIDPVFGDRDGEGETRLIISSVANDRVEVREDEDVSFATIGRLTEIGAVAYYEIEKYELVAADPEVLNAIENGKDSQTWQLLDTSPREWQTPKLVAKVMLKDGDLFVASAYELDELLRNAVAAGTLAGELVDETLHVTATTEELLAFLRKHPSHPAWSVACYKRVGDLAETGCRGFNDSKTLIADR